MKDNYFLQNIFRDVNWSRSFFKCLDIYKVGNDGQFLFM